MSILVFILLFIIMIGLIYLVHRYLSKSELYLLTLIYGIISFIMSFKMINIFGIYVNGSIIFNTGLIMILYYFINKYNEKEIKRLIISIILSICFIDVLVLINGLIEPSLYNNNYAYFRDMVVNNYMIFILYPIFTFISLFLYTYLFKEIKKIKEDKDLKILLPILGLTFIDIFIFVFLTNIIKFRFGISFMIALGNYIVKSFIMIGSIFLIDRIVKIKKVKP